MIPRCLPAVEEGFCSLFPNSWLCLDLSMWELRKKSRNRSSSLSALAHPVTMEDGATVTAGLSAATTTKEKEEAMGKVSEQEVQQGKGTQQQEQQQQQGQEQEEQETQERLGGLSEEELQEMRDCEAIDGEEESFLLFLGLMSSSAKEKADAIDEGLKNNDFKMVYEAGHAIKGSALQCSLRKMGNVAQEVNEYFKALHEKIQEPDQEKTDRLVKSFKHEAERIKVSADKLNAS